MLLRQAPSGPVITGTVDGQVLTWNAAAAEWFPATPPGGSGVQSVTAAPEDPGIDVDNTDPENPVLTNTGVHDVTSGAGISVDNTDPRHPVVNNSGVLGVSAGNGIDVDNTDPQNPIVSLPTANVVQSTDTAGGTITPTYSFAQSFTPGARGVIVTCSVTFSPGTPGDQVDVWVENDAAPGVRLQSLTLSSAGTGLQAVTISVIDSPTPDVVTAYRVFASNAAAGSVTVPANGASVQVQGL